MKKGELNLWVFVILLFMTSCSGLGAGSPPDPQDYTIVWDQSTLERISPDIFRYAGYARVRELANEHLGVAYEADGNIFFRIKENGVWKEPVLVAPRKEGEAMAVPDFTVLDNGEILLAYNPRPRRNQQDKHFAIRIVRSSDHGQTWQEDQLVYEAGTTFENGCWEPVFLTLPDGTIQLYFADEGIFTETNEQRIAMLASTDGGYSWSESPQTISYRKGSRDGMPVPVLLEDQTIAMAIEDNGFGPFKPYIIKADGLSWKETVNADHPHRKYAMAEQIPPNDYAGAPYLAQGVNGLTLLSFQWGSKLEDAQMAVAIGNEQALHFTNTTWPFQLPQESIGHWNSITVLQDGKILALTSTNGFSDKGQTEVWMIQGELVGKE
ncbi:exo-alpha-sialidase [Echinicola sp. CAU 1574]|uniref:Exo-alpha-sialidase n=1 Tax=Echinicola arenosa TaxID=2774144 RepID=A0ABR9AF99_9BACT|nr:sialidase family protein [Echinicola arenosa]MBD8487285.1 exo-alpha-sialidase [Echinicola arenosa]